MRAAYDLIRSKVPYVKEDMILYPYVEVIKDMIRSGELVTAVESAVGALEEPKDYDQPIEKN